MRFDTTRAEIFDGLSESWDERVPAPPGKALSALIDVLDIDDKTVLDIGAGTGVLLSAIGEKTPSRWIACDISKKMLDILSMKFAKKMPFLETLNADAHSLPLDSESVDRVICNGVFPHFSDKDAALKEIRRVLKPNGILIINHFGGRERINSVHSSSDNPTLRNDLLIPAGDLAALLTLYGFVIKGALDNEHLYRVVSSRSSGTAERD